MTISEYFYHKLGYALTDELIGRSKPLLLPYDEFPFESYCGLRSQEIIDQAAIFLAVCRDDHPDVTRNIAKAALAAIEVCLFG